MLTVYKASAGSGKTFQLVVEYIKLLLENPQNYKHILAVTFTNKATNEMKTRILEQLNELAQNHPSTTLAHLQSETNYTEEFIRKRAKIILKNILHDYNRFSISTIDSFTQRTIKAFNRELGISPNFTVELDSDMVLAEATDRMLAKIDKDKKLLSWLKEFSKEKIEDNYSQRIEEDIKALGKELFKENFQVFFPEDSESVYNRKHLDEFAKELRQLKLQFENTLKNFGKEGIEMILESGLVVEDFAYGKSGVAGFIQKIAEGEVKEAGTRVLHATEDVEKWYTKTSKKKAEIHALAEVKLQALLQDLLFFYNENTPQYFTVLAVLKQLRMLGILTDLREEIKLLAHEKGILQMSDSNLLLSKIIGQSDSPFIYEKTGSYYNHFMLDEFQDTSGLQWHNFKPLITNSLAEGNKNLLVGDVKQSIYRWRNSDWRILAEQIYTDFTDAQRREKPLVNNWRSDLNIIEFNNAVFDELKTVFEEIQFRAIDDAQGIFVEKFRKIYEHISQTPGNAKAEKKGFVKFSFYDEEGFKETSEDALIEQVKELQDKGIKASETAILIRTNKEGTSIVERFLQAAKLPENSGYNLSVLSNESLFLHASQGVAFIITTVKLLINPENQIAKVALLNLWQNWLKPELQQRGKLAPTENSQLKMSFETQGNQSFYESFETLFRQELFPKMEQAKAKVLLASLDETITQIASIFGIFEVETELPFVQTLIDKAGELKTSLSNDLSNLLFWWNEKGSGTSVNVNEGLDAIRLLTVHKSKGLEYKAVLLPYFDWKTSPKFAPLLWCRPQTAPFNQFPLLPLRSGSSLEKSLFSFEYFEEKVNTYIDVFNLVYVAFTRAKSALIVHCPVPKEPKNQSGDTSKPMHYLCNKALENLSTSIEFAGAWNNDKTVFQFGQLIDSHSESKASESELIKNYSFNDFSERVKLRLSGKDFLTTDESHHSVKNIGKLIHEILAEIKTKADLEKACLAAFNKGAINKTELTEIQNSLQKSMENPEISRWFDGSFAVINERNLLTANRILRPDRLMTDGKNAIVVDYKTGDKKSKNYRRQVKRYAEMLKKTGFGKVEGFLWHIGLNEVEKVCEL